MPIPNHQGVAGVQLGVVVPHLLCDIFRATFSRFFSIFPAFSWINVVCFHQILDNFSQAYRSLRNDNKISRHSNWHFQNFIFVVFPAQKSVFGRSSSLPPMPPLKTANFIFIVALPSLSLVNFSQLWSALSRSCKTKTQECLTDRKVGENNTQVQRLKTGSPCRLGQKLWKKTRPWEVGRFALQRRSNNLFLNLALSGPTARPPPLYRYSYRV